VKKWFSIRYIKKGLKELRNIMGDPETPLLARILMGLALGYLLSPIDLIPDFIPVIGYLDDVIIVPVLILLALLCVPPGVRSRHLSGSNPPSDSKADD